jgi:type 1 fimbria pilin
MFIRKSLFAAVVITIGSMSLAQAAISQQGNGKVTFKGSILDAPCSISSDSEDQTVQLGMISNVALKDGGKSKPQNFQIKLENCELSNKKTVTVSFAGQKSSNSDLLGITGTAKGAGVALTDGNGQLITLTSPTSARTLQDGNNTMQFSAYLQGEVQGKEPLDPKIVITPGEFTAVADFTLAYQ